MAQRTAINILQATDAFAITPSDSGLIAADSGNTRGFDFCYIHVAGTSGLISVVTAEGTAVSVYGVQGTTIPLLVKQVKSTGTAATTLIGFVGQNPVC